MARTRDARCSSPTSHFRGQKVARSPPTPDLIYRACQRDPGPAIPSCFFNFPCLNFVLFVKTFVSTSLQSICTVSFPHAPIGFSGEGRLPRQVGAEVPARNDGCPLR